MSTKIQIPAIRYEQGGRVMYAAVMEPRALVKLVEEPKVWNPVSKSGVTGTNRSLSKPHVAGIVDYMERTLAGTNGEYVMDSVTLYGDDADLEFAPDKPGDAPIQSGVLGISLDALFDIGNGQHRITAHETIINNHPDPNDPVAIAQRNVGQPVVIVADRSPLHRAQDFVTLQRNVKSLPGSLAESMDRSQPLNAFLIDLCKVPNAPAILGNYGDRLEFDKDVISKYGQQLLTYKSYRYITGTALIGVDQRTTAGWKKSVNSAFDKDRAVLESEIQLMWDEWGKLPGIADVLAGTKSPLELREQSLILGGAVSYACAYAVHLLKVREGLGLGDAVKRLTTVNFDRPTRTPTEQAPLTSTETIFAGNIIDPATGKVASGRPAWEAAGEVLYDTVK